MIKSYRKLHELLLPFEKRNFFFLIVLMIVEAGMEMLGVGIIPVFVTLIAFPEQVETSQWLQSVVGTESGRWLRGENAIYWGSFLLLLFFAIKSGFSVASVYWKSRYAQNISLRLSQRLYSAYMKAPHAFHVRRNTPDLIRNINSECILLSVHVLIPMIDMMSQAIIIAAIVAIIILSVPYAALFWLVLFLGLGIGSAMVLHKKVRKLGLEAQTHRSLMIQTVKEGLEGIKEISLMARTGYFIQRFLQSFARQLQIQRIMQVIQNGLPQLIEFVTIVGLLGVTVMLFAKGYGPEKVVPVLTVFTVALVRMKGSMKAIMHDYTNIRHSGVSLDLIYSELNELENGMSRKGSVARKDSAFSFNKQIEIKNLSYKYPDSDRHALNGINLTITKGEAIGFVGTTGAGKSTLIDAVIGVLPPDKGRILVDGQDISGQLRGWHEKIGYIPQKIFLIDGTVKQNIALGINEQDLDQSALDQAIHVSNLTTLMASLPDGVETLIGEQGIRLSGGERQRIAIARAIYNNPDLLVMDEATSALDNITEATVVQEVEALKGSRTILVIAHRLSTVRRCDRIVFLKNGAIDAIGNYSELVDSHPEFMKMTRAAE